jgi:hypothetical protein
MQPQNDECCNIERSKRPKDSGETNSIGESNGLTLTNCGAQIQESRYQKCCHVCALLGVWVKGVECFTLVGIHLTFSTSCKGLPATVFRFRYG